MSKLFPFKIRRNHYLTNRSLLISNLQKTIRRGLPDRALRTAMVLGEYHLTAFVRRLPIIIFEDVLLHPYMPLLTDIMERVSKKRAITHEDVTTLLQVVLDLCKYSIRDSLDTTLINRYTGREELSNSTTELIRAIHKRSRYGGMKWDMEMLTRYAQLWTVRFSENKEYWWEFLHHHFPDVITVNPDHIGTLQKNDLLLESVDFHCSPVTRIAAKKPEFQHLIYRLYGKVNAQEKIDDVVWELRSSVNKREVFWDPSLPVDEIELNSSEMREKHLMLYNAISQQIDSISHWYINKVKERK